MALLKQTLLPFPNAIMLSATDGWKQKIPRGIFGLAN